MARALSLVFAALLASALELLYFSLPGVFLLQLGFGECFRSSTWHAFWSLAGWVLPLLTPLLLWLASQELRRRPKHPIFGLHILIQFLCGLLIASGFFALRLIWRLDSPLLQASLFVGYALTLDLCAEAMSWRRLARPVWVGLAFVVALAASFVMRQYPPVVRTADLGEMRLRLLGRTVFERSAPVCLSAASLAAIPWRPEELQRAALRQACLPWPFQLEMPAAFRHCVKEPIPVAPAAPAEAMREETVVVAGDARVGSVTILGQVHHREEDTPQQRWGVVESQLYIYEELLRNVKWPVFSEGACSGPVDPKRAGELAPSVASSKASWSPAYTRLAFATLGAVGALDEAGFLSSLATLRCDDPQLEELDRLEAQFDLTDPAAPQYDSLLARLDYLRMEYRERQAVEKIRDNLKTHPGAQVYLVYGEAHEFPERLWREAFGARAPRVKAVRWSTAVSAGWDLESLNQGEERLAWIRSAPAFLTGALAQVRTPAELFLMLPKLSPEPFRDVTPERARERITALLNGLPFRLSPAEHLRVSEYVWRAYREGSGPFQGYRFPGQWLEKFRRLSAAEQALALGDLTEPYLQWQAMLTMSRVPLESYPDLLLPEARIDALDRLEIPPVLSAEEVREYLESANQMMVDMGGKLSAKVQARFGSRQ
jgi:hypothetical protein